MVTQKQKETPSRCATQGKLAKLFINLSQQWEILSYPVCKAAALESESALKSAKSCQLGIDQNGEAIRDREEMLYSFFRPQRTPLERGTLLGERHHARSQ